MGRHHHDARQRGASELRLYVARAFDQSEAPGPAALAAGKGNALRGDEGCEINGEGNFERIAFWKTPVAKCASNPDTGCVPYYRWVSDYIAILGGR